MPAIGIRIIQGLPDYIFFPPHYFIFCQIHFLVPYSIINFSPAMVQIPKAFIKKTIRQNEII
jgi:hypothetical protein